MGILHSLKYMNLCIFHQTLAGHIDDDMQMPKTSRAKISETPTNRANFVSKLNRTLIPLRLRCYVLVFNGINPE